MGLVGVDESKHNDKIMAYIRMKERRLFISPKDIIGPKRVAVENTRGSEDCAEGVVLALISTYGKRADYDQIYDDLGTTKDGTSDTDKIVKVLRSKGLRVREHGEANIDTIKRALQRKHFCLVEYQAPDNDYRSEFLREKVNTWRVGKSVKHGHYSIVFGFDNNDGDEKFFLMDPLIQFRETRYGRGIRSIPVGVFEKRWMIGKRKHVGWMLEVTKK
ncbi:MAG: hypothetical protein UU16_C0032G0010 [Candidatus Woesebacteria bacterium GW2011_GWA2_40_7]|uniref:Peptidase C39-like domain-containing protein n=3 Tax=Candidatus Woeseibacteriota TaxID=1752722 RepID=A0A0G0UTW4_9BACT|nr:MAG: hypothetical protein UT17_C0001G0003 [Candidatus Woesebacteria bacterium GW2011_GWB1_39_10]KKR73058.1 MAG: hypothetical protein UU16_C0032G0010 [Candidatus Woesebacteria bacterium GW2011_GWA2_40_7]KKR92189.1 MAG: hypothetical protein UU42_C0002G0003 [Candidatus Woesebacteria bacterium GW2011_GWA1_41_13b]